MNDVLVNMSLVSKSFRDHEVLHDVDFFLRRGEIVALLGVNGAGKTTTMNILSGIIQPSQGKVLIKGNDINNSSNQIKRNIGYLSENNPLYEDMYVKEYLDYVSRIYLPKAIARQRVAQMIEQVGLTKEYKKKIQTLSKGNKQRVGFAQALVHDPDILVLDEPTNGFDPHQQEEMKELLLQLKESKTILFSTHHLQEVSDIASRYLILDKGKLVFNDIADPTNSIDNLFYNLTK